LLAQPDIATAARAIAETLNSASFIGS